MDGIAAWITPALLVALFAWLRFDMREQRREVRADMQALNTRLDELNKQFNERLDGMIKRLDERLDGMNKQFNDRFDQVQRGLGDLRERMAKLEGALEGFLAGRRDRDAA